MKTEAKLLTITLLGKPRGKQRPRVTRRGITYTPKETVNYETALRMEAAATMLQEKRKPYEGPLQVSVDAYFPVAASWPKKMRMAALNGYLRYTKKPDADNILKMLDALNGVVWGDDVQIVHATVIKYYSDQPRLVVTVYPLAPVEETR